MTNVASAPAGVADPHRPVYHFSPTAWMNDPKPFFWNGVYHVFFQHNPHGAFWGTMHWGHAASRDLVHWDELPIALAPTPGGPDKDGCFTGCVVRSGDDKRFHILYTGVDPQVQCLATSDDPDLVAWQKDARNPIIGAPPPGFGECFRDPQAWKDADGSWLMVIGSELPERRGGAALLYRSPAGNLADWEYLHPLFAGSEHETGFDFECPDFFALGNGRHVLLTSRNQTWWHLGDCDAAGRRFSRTAWGCVDGGALYAAKTLQDDRGRRLLFGWIRETRPGEAQIAAGWSGVLSLPRELCVLPSGGALGQEPAREIEALRGAQQQFAGRAVAGQTQPLGECSDTVEIQAHFAPTQAARHGVTLEWPDGTRADIVYDRATGQLNDSPLALANDESLHLRVFVDRSVIEVFANGRACQTLRVYPTVHGNGDNAGRVRLGLVAEGGDGAEASVNVWEMTPAPVTRQRRP